MKIIEKTVLDQFKNGDHKAFERIFLSYYDQLKTFISSLIYSNDNAEELTQDIFLKLWISRESIDSEKPFNSYLYTIARNTSFNYLKWQFVRKAYQKDYMIARHDFSSNSVEDAFFAKEIRAKINQTIKNMPSRRKSIYLYSKMKGYSNDEIAKKLNISKKTVENQLSLAIKEIKKVTCGLLV